MVENNQFEDNTELVCEKLLMRFKKKMMTVTFFKCSVTHVQSIDVFNFLSFW